MAATSDSRRRARRAHRGRLRASRHQGRHRTAEVPVVRRHVRRHGDHPGQRTAPLDVAMRAHRMSGERCSEPGQHATIDRACSFRIGRRCCATKTGSATSERRNVPRRRPGMGIALSQRSSQAPAHGRSNATPTSARAFSIAAVPDVAAGALRPADPGAPECGSRCRGEEPLLRRIAFGVDLLPRLTRSRVRDLGDLGRPPAQRGVTQHRGHKGLGDYRAGGGWGA